VPFGDVIVPSGGSSVQLAAEIRSTDAHSALLAPDYLLLHFKATAPCQHLAQSDPAFPAFPAYAGGVTYAA